jgi:hypothetical protein
MEYSIIEREQAEADRQRGMLRAQSLIQKFGKPTQGRCACGRIISANKRQCLECKTKTATAADGAATAA